MYSYEELIVTDNVRILSEREIKHVKRVNALRDDAIIYGTFENIFGAEIALGDGNITAEKTAQTLNHETIHETLTEIFDRGMSLRFDRDLCYNFETCKHSGEFFDKILIREALIALFTFAEGEPLV